jgi:hypothetical protein
LKVNKFIIKHFYRILRPNRHHAKVGDTITLTPRAGVGVKTGTVFADDLMFTETLDVDYMKPTTCKCNKGRYVAMCYRDNGLLCAVYNLKPTDYYIV